MFTFINVGSLAKSLNGSFNNSMIASFAYFINPPLSCVVYGAVIRDGIPKGCVSSVCVQCVCPACEPWRWTGMHAALCALASLGGTVCSKENTAVLKVCSLCSPDAVSYTMVLCPGLDQGSRLHVVKIKCP